MRFRNQVITWVVILIILIASFPVYNSIIGRPIFDSHSLSSFDIVEVTALVYLLYVVNYQRQKIEHNESRLRELHQKLSIKSSNTKR